MDGPVWMLQGCRAGQRRERGQCSCVWPGAELGTYIHIISFHPPTQLLRDGLFICGAPNSLLQSAGKNNAKARDGKNKRRKRKMEGKREEGKELGSGVGRGTKQSLPHKRSQGKDTLS